MAADTQGDFITLDSKAFKDFRDNLTTIVSQLDKMGDQLGVIESRFKAINFKVKGLQDLKDLLTFVSSQRGIRNADKFKTFVGAVQDLSKAAQIATSIDTSGFKKLNSFITLMGTLAATKGISPGQVTQLVSSIQNFVVQIVSSLKALSAGVGGDKATTQVVNIIGGLRTILTVFDKVNTLKVDPQAVAVFAAEITHLLSLFQAIAAGTKADAFDSILKLGKTLTLFANVLGGGKGGPMERLTEVGLSAARFIIVVPAILLALRGLFLLINVFTAVPTLLVGGLGEKIDNSIRSFANSISTMIKSFGGDSKDAVSAAGIGRTLAVMIKLGVVVPVLFFIMTTTFKLTSTLIALVPGNDQLFKLADSFRRVASAFFNFSLALTPEKGGGGLLGAIAGLVKVAGKIILLGVVVPAIFGFTALLFKSIALVVRLIPSTDSLASLSTAFRNIGLSFESFSESLGGSKGGLFTTIGQFVKLGIVIPTLFTVMAVLFRAIALILRILPGGDAFLQLTIAFKNLGGALESIAAVGSGKTILGVIKSVIALKLVSDSVKGLVVGLVKANVFQQVIDFMKNFSLLGQGIKNVVTATKSLGITDLIGLVIKMKVIGDVIAATAKTVAGADPQAAITLGLVMKNVGQALKNIRLALSQDIEGKSQLLGILQIVKLIITLKTVLGVVKGIAQSASPAQLEAASKLTASLGKLITSLFAALSTTTLQKVDIKGALSIKDKINVVKDIFKALKDFRGKDLPDFGSTFEALPKFLESIGKLNLTAGKGEQSIKDKVKVLTDSLKELSKLKVNKGTIDTLSKLAASLEVFTKIKSPGKVGDLLVNLVTGLNALKSAGFTSKDFKLLSGFIDQIVKSLNGLSNLKTTKDQVAALEALVSALQEINKSSGEKISLGGITKGLSAEATTAGKLTGNDLAEGVAEGLLRFNIRATIVKFLGQIALGILNLFNPVTIFGGFKKGAQIIGDFFTFVIDKFNKLKETIQQFGQGIVTLGTNIEGVGNSISSSLGVGNILNSPFFTEATNFDKLSTQVKVFGNLTDTEVGKLRDLAFEIGKEFPLSASDALSAAKDLIKTGLNEQDVEKALRPIANLAALTDSGDIATASRGLVQVTSAFKQFTADIPANFDNLSTASDILSRAADNSTASVESLIEGLGNVGPIAAAFNVSLEDASAVLGIFENNGIRGAEAGTALKSILTNFTTQRARDEFHSLGVALTDSKGNFRNLNDIITDLNDKFNKTTTVSVKLTNVTKDQKAQFDAASKVLASTTRQIFLYQNGLTTGSLDEKAANDKLADLNKVRQHAIDLIAQMTGSQETAQTIMKDVTRTQDQNATSLLNLGGRYGGVGLSALIAAGDDGLKAFIDQMNNLPGSAERAQELLDNFAGDTIQLQGSVETLMTLALEPLLNNFFRPAVKLFRAVIDGVLGLDHRFIVLGANAVGLFAIFASGIGTFLIITGKLAALGGAVIEFSSVIFNLQSIFFGVLKLGLGLITGLATLVVTVLPLIVVFTALSVIAQTVADIFKNNVGGAGHALGLVLQRISELAGSAGEAFSGFFETISAIFGGGGSGGDSPLVAIGRFFTTVLGGAAHKLFEFNRTVFALAVVFKTLAGTLAGGFLTSAENERLRKNPIVAALFGIRGEKLDAAAIDKLFNSIFVHSNKIKAVFGNISSAFSGFFSSLSKGANIGDAINLLRTNLEKGFGDLAVEVVSLFGDLFNVDVSNITDQIKDQGIIATLQKVIASLGDKIRSFLLNHRGQITDILVSIFRFFVSPGAIIGTIARLLGANQVANIIDQIGNIFADLFRGVLDFIFNLLSGQDLGTAFSNAFGPIAPKVITSIRDILNGAISLLGGALGIDPQTFIDQITVGFQPLIDSFATGDPLKIFGGLGDAVVTLISSAIQLGIAGLGNLLGIDTQTAQDQIKLGFKPLEIAFQNGDPGQIFGGVSVAIATLLAVGIQTAINTVGDLLHFDTQIIFDDLFAGFQPLADGILAGDPLVIFGGVVSALSGALGGAITLALEAIGSVLHIDFSKVTSSINDSIHAGADAAATGDVGGAAGGFVGAIGDFFAGAIGGVFTKIGDLLHIDMTTVLANIDTTLDNNTRLIQTGGPGAPFAVLANTIAGLFASAVDGIFATVGTLLHIDTADLQKQITDKFGVVITAINDLFVGSEGKPSAFQDIADIINDVVNAVKSLFSVFTPAATSAGKAAQAAVNPFQVLLQFFTTIASLTLETIATPLRALKILLDRVASLDPQQTLIVLTALTGLFVAMRLSQLSSAAGGLLPLLQSILPLGGSIGVIGGLKSLIQTAASSTIAKGAALFVIIDFVANLVRNLTSLQHVDLAGVISGVVQSFIDLGTDLAAAVGLPVDGLKLQVTNTLNQIQILFRLAGASIMDSLNTVLFQPAILGLQNLVLGARILKEQLQEGADVGRRAQFDASLLAAQTLGGSGAKSFKDYVNNVLLAGVDSGFNDAIQGPIVKEQLRVTAQQKINDITNEFVADIEALQPTGKQTADSQAALAQWISALNLVGGVGQAATAALSHGDFNLFGQIITEATKQGVDPGTFTGIIDNLQLGFEEAVRQGKGGEAFTNVNNLLDFLIGNADNLHLDPVKLQAIKDSIKKEFDGIITDAANTAGQTPTDVTITPGVITTTPATPAQQATNADTVTDGMFVKDAQGNIVYTPTGVQVKVDDGTITTDVDPTAVQTSVQTAVQGGDTPLVVTPDTTIQPNITVTSSTEADEFTAALERLQTALDPSRTSVQGLTTDTGALSLAIQDWDLKTTTADSDIVTAIDDILSAWTPFAAVVKPDLLYMATQITAISDGFTKWYLTLTIFTPLILLYLNNLKLAVMDFTETSITDFTTLNDKLIAVSKNLFDILAMVDAIKKSGVPTTNPDGSITYTFPAGTPGGQNGITVHPNRIYQVTENNDPELLTMNGKTYLLPGSSGTGQVIPSIDPTSILGATVPSPTARPKPYGQTASGGDIVYNEGNVSLVIQVPNGNPQAIADVVEARLNAMKADDSKKIKDRLRTAGR